MEYGYIGSGLHSAVVKARTAPQTPASSSTSGSTNTTLTAAVPSGVLTATPRPVSHLSGEAWYDSIYSIIVFSCPLFFNVLVFFGMSLGNIIAIDLFLLAAVSQSGVNRSIVVAGTSPTGSTRQLVTTPANPQQKYVIVTSRPNSSPVCVWSSLKISKSQLFKKKKLL